MAEVYKGGFHDRDGAVCPWLLQVASLLMARAVVFRIFKCVDSDCPARSNLPTGTGPITSATFDLKPRAFFGDGSSETVNFTEFVLSPSLLTTAYAPNNATGVSLYNALSSGASYGQLAVQPSDALLGCQLPACPSQPGNTLLFQFNSLGLADINADLGGVFVVGAYLSPSSSDPTFNAVGVQFNFLGVTGPISQLDLSTAPEPGTASLFAIAVLAVLIFRRFRGRGSAPASVWLAPGE